MIGLTTGWVSEPRKADESGCRDPAEFLEDLATPLPTDLV